MRLRQLQKKDAVHMLEWMHDEDVASNLGKDFQSMKIENCLQFIEDSKEDKRNCHFAIVDEKDEYMGTISLKNIDRENKRAEYAIACRQKAIGHGFAVWASKELFRIAKSEMNLRLLYLNVYENNIRAQKMYDKVGFKIIEKPSFILEDIDSRLIWLEKQLT